MEQMQLGMIALGRMGNQYGPSNTTGWASLSTNETAHTPWVYSWKHRATKCM